MIKILASAALFLGLANGAFAKDVAQYSFNHTGADGNREIDTLTLSDDGVATIARLALSNDDLFAPGTKALKPIKKALAKEVFETLKYKLINLSTAAIETTHQDFVCMMMPMPGAARSLLVATNYDYETASFKGDLVLVLTQTGCWSPTHVAPKEAYEKEEAKAVVAALEVLGLTFVAAK